MTKPTYFDIPDLRLFVSVVEEGSISRGAEKMPLALSAASARIKALEHRLSLVLLLRQPQGIKLTDAGKHFYDYSRRILQTAYDAQIGMNALSGVGRIKLILRSNTTGLSTRLSKSIGKFLIENPTIDFDFEQMASRHVIQAVKNGDADIGIVDGYYGNDDLLFTLYQKIKLVVISHKNHPISEADHCTFSEWLQHPIIGLPKESSLQQFIQRMSVLSHEPLNIRISAPNFSSVAQMVSEDLGIAMLPEPAADQYASNLPIVKIPLNETWATREVNICVRPNSDTSIPALKLAEFLINSSAN